MLGFHKLCKLPCVSGGCCGHPHGRLHALNTSTSTSGRIGINTKCMFHRNCPSALQPGRRPLLQHARPQVQLQKHCCFLQAIVLQVTTLRHGAENDVANCFLPSGVCIVVAARRSQLYAFLQTYLRQFRQPRNPSGCIWTLWLGWPFACAARKGPSKRS